MARTPSKITKRDIDKNLYLEIVSEANNKTNIEKLLGDYVRKDEGILEWQLPEKYRSSLMERLDNIDASIQSMKNDTSQKTINANFEKRLETVEKSQDIEPDDDSSTSSPIIGTQVAANTSNISQNTKSIESLDSRIKNLESEISDSRSQYQSADQKIKNDTNTRFMTDEARITTVETDIRNKRNKSDLITADDLDDSVKNNINAVLKIGSSTIKALDNFDDVMQKIDTYDTRIDQNRKNISDTNTKIDTVKSELLQSINERVTAVQDTEKTDIQSLTNTIDTFKQEVSTSNASVQTQIGSIRSSVDSQQFDIRDIHNEIASVTRSAQANSESIARYADTFDFYDSKFDQQAGRIEQNESSIQALQEDANKHHGVPQGKLLYISDEDGLVEGKNIIIRCYTAEEDMEIKKLMAGSLSPILDLRSGYAYFIKTAEEIAADTERAAQSKADGEQEIVGDEVKDDDDQIAQTDEDKLLFLKYHQQEGFGSLPESRNSLIFDDNTRTIVAYIDGDGMINPFYAKSGGYKSEEIEIEAGSFAEYSRDDALMRTPVTVYVVDLDQDSKTFGRWINSEGVATVAYDESSFTIYNNSNKKQTFKILED